VAVDIPRKSTAQGIAEALGGHRNGKGWICRCPAHSDNTPSLSIVEREGKVLLFCHAGCAQAEVIKALRKARVWRGGQYRRSDHDHRGDHEAPARDPLRSWRNTRPGVRGTLLEVYLGRRGIVLTDAEAEALRFAPMLMHWPSRIIAPAMIALVKLASGAELTVHQTFLARDGSSKAPVVKPRLFPPGVSPLGGGVWFGAPGSGEIVVGEGIESTLSAMRLLGTSAGVATLSELGVRKLILPPEAKRAHIFADHDPGGQGRAAAREACQRWRAEGREVRVTLPSRVGEDANNILMKRLGLS
jgi:hypothetical protein